MTLSLSSVGRLGLSRKEEERTTLADRGRSRQRTLVREKSDNGRVPSLSVPLSALAKMLAVECGKMVTLPIS